MTLSELINLWSKQFNNRNWKEIEEKILIYKNFLQLENKKFNLTRLDSENDVYQKYFYESVINFESSLFEKENLNILDIGSGSGIPGIILKIIYPDINLHIVESNSKKCNFLEQLKIKLNLENVFIHNQRCEDFIKTKIEFFDLITCRAVAELRILLELAIPGLKINGIAYFLKSSNYIIELEQSEKISTKLELKAPIVNKIEFDSKMFVSIKYIKVSKTNKNFPRTWKEILNNDKN